MMQPSPDRPPTTTTTTSSPVPVLASFFAVLVAVVLGTAGIVFGAVALATRPSVVTRPSVGTNPWVYQMTRPDADGVQIKGIADSSTNLEIWFDHNGAPIAAVDQAGGFKVFGDNIGVYPPGNVNQSSVELHDTGGVTLSVGGPTLYGGAHAPSMACKTGDFYLRQSLARDTRIYQCDAGRWVPIL
jgi:hypothetical protein